MKLETVCDGIITGTCDDVPDPYKFVFGDTLPERIYDEIIKPFDNGEMQQKINNEICKKIG